MKLTNKNIRRNLAGYFDDIEGEKVYHIEAELGVLNAGLLASLIYKTQKKGSMIYPNACIHTPRYRGPVFTENSEDSMAVWVYQPQGTVHVVSNDITYAWNAFIDNIFPERKDFEAFIDKINVSGDWTNDKDLLNVFTDFANPYIVGRDHADDDE